MPVLSSTVTRVVHISTSEGEAQILLDQPEGLAQSLVRRAMEKPASSFRDLILSSRICLALAPKGQTVPSPYFGRRGRSRLLREGLFNKRGCPGPVVVSGLFVASRRRSILLFLIRAERIRVAYSSELGPCFVK